MTASRNIHPFLFVTLALCGSLAPADEARRDLRRTPVVQVVENTRDSIVNISSTRVIPGVRVPFGFGMLEEFFHMPSETTSLGSGFVIHEDGYIVTNAHVVARTTELTVTLSNGQEYQADIVATDVEHDVAVIKIETPPGQNLEPITWGTSKDLMIGETAIAIGNPVGLQHTVTTGVISALHREARLSRQVVYEDLIQTDASINPGNSGGPLLNIFGELIGVNTAIRGDAQNIGFAIPVDQLRDVLPAMLDIENRYRVDIGLSVEGVRDARVTDVRDGGAADQAGLEVGDIIESIDGRPIRESIGYHIAMLGREPNDRVQMRVRRGDEHERIVMTLKELPIPDGSELADRLYGMRLAPLGNALARKLGVRPNTGVLVTEVDRNGPADRVGIRPGDLLIQLGRLSVRDLETVGLVLEGVRSDDPKYIRILRVSPRGAFHTYEGIIYAR